MSDLPTKTEVKKYLADAMRIYGAFEVANLLAQAANESSKQYKEAGNDGAVIHRDAASLERCVENMVGNHLMRAMEYAP